MADHGADLLGPVLVDLEEELVVNLEEQQLVGKLRPQPDIHRQHRLLDEVGGAALDRGVDGHPFGGGAGGEVAAREVRNRPPPAHQGFDVAVLGGLGKGALAVLLDLRKSFLVPVDVVRSFRARDPQGLREPEGALTVDDAEVHRLCDRPHLARNLLGRHVEEAGRGLGVDVGAACEGVRKTARAAA